MKRYYIPLPRFVMIPMIPYRLIKGIWRLITRATVSKRDRSVLRWLSFVDHPIRSQDREVTNFMELEHAIETAQPVTFNYVNITKERSQRKILPQRLFRRKEVIYCRGFDSFHQEYRAFRLDRMSNLKIDEDVGP